MIAALASALGSHGLPFSSQQSGRWAERVLQVPGRRGTLGSASSRLPPHVLDCPSRDPSQLDTSRWVSQAVGLRCGCLCSQPWGRVGAGGSGSESEVLWGSFSKTLTSLWPQK